MCCYHQAAFIPTSKGDKGAERMNKSKKWVSYEDKKK